MRFEIKQRPYDLYSIIAASAILVLIILIIPDFDVARIILGLPFILFFPGYVLISALYPEKKRFFDKDGKEVSPPTDDDEDEKENKKGPDEDTDGVKGKGLDGLERIALSLGLSIAITPLIGLILNYTYDWAPDTLGIRLIPILLSQFTFILIVGSIAIYKRNKVPLEDRFSIVIDLTIPEDYSNMDKVLTVGIVIMMVLSVGMLIYIIVVPREGESFTEFYILGAGHKAEGYPRNIYLEESQFIYIGIGNHEHEDVNYTLILTIDGGAVNQTVSSFNNVTISRSRQPLMDVIVENGDTKEIQCNFTALETGSYKLRFLLFRDGEEYRDLHIWIKVFEVDFLHRAINGNIEFYIAGSGGDPSLLPTQIGSDDPLPISIGSRNQGDDDLSSNISFKVGPVDTWVSVDQTEIGAYIGEGKGAYIEIDTNSTSSFGPFDLLLFLPDGEWTIEIVHRSDLGTFTIHYPVKVGDG